ncbi:hypothetical protein ACNOYE_34135 [Nannocystaceae bacterium ST9]
MHLPAAAHALFREIDGLRVFWRVKPGLAQELWEAYLAADPSGWYIDPERTHGILIGRLEEILRFQGWPRQFSVIGHDSAPGLAERILPFDFYLRHGNEDACMAMILADDAEQTRVAMLVSSGCYYPSQAHTDLANYLELVLASRGEISVRERFEQSGGMLTFDPGELADLEHQLFRRPIGLR